jgi:dihydroneopterin aldolase
LADTVDYYELCAMLVELGEARAHRLLEALAASMLRAIKVRWPHVTVEIELRKLHPPCPGNPAFTAARIKG